MILAAALTLGLTTMVTAALALQAGAPSARQALAPALLAPATRVLAFTPLTAIPPLEQAMLAATGQARARYRAPVSAFFTRPSRRGAPR